MVVRLLVPVVQKSAHPVQHGDEAGVVRQVYHLPRIGPQVEQLPAVAARSTSMSRRAGKRACSVAMSSWQSLLGAMLVSTSLEGLQGEDGRRVAQTGESLRRR